MIRIRSPVRQIRGTLEKTVIAQRIITETLTAPSSPAVEKTAVLC
jgi:hypothetical protein